MEPELKARLDGQLPTIRIIDQDYYIDWRLRELRMKEDASKVLKLSDMGMDRKGNHYLCFYDAEQKSAVQIPNTITEMPTGVVVIKIPYELKLDPVGVAREFGLGDTELLKKFPIQKNLVAEVIALKQTGLPAMIKANKMALQKSPQIKRRIK